MRGTVRRRGVSIGTIAIALAISCRTAFNDSVPAASPAPARIGQAVLFNGLPFPDRPAFSKELPAAARTYYVSSKAPAGGNGTRERPWSDLMTGLRALSAGERLEVGEGEYRGPIRIDDSCRAGTETAPIVVLFRKAILKPAHEQTILTATRPYWRFDRLAAELEEATAAAIAVEGPGARGVVLHLARIDGGGGAAVRIGSGASKVIVANSVFFKGGHGSPSLNALGVIVEPGSSDVRIVGNLVMDHPAGAVKIGRDAADGSGPPPPRNVIVEGNTFVDSFSPAVVVAQATALRISANTILARPSSGGLAERGIVVECGSAVRIERNHVVDASVSIQVGWREPGGPDRTPPSDVLVAENYFERRASSETVGVDVESGTNVRIANNVFDGISDGLLVFGTRPRTQGLVVANNLLFGISGIAFRADDLACASLFDANVFSPRGATVSVELGGRTLDLREYLRAGHMRASRVLPDVRMIHQDLARIQGVETRGRGLPVEGISSRGPGQDLGITGR